ncbi:transposase [Streptomyces sp. NPDC058322]|uniref:transposase n=1 Tax=unclassified Streptomyces TaxID=2593676 RepID=UPI0036E1FE5A
MEASPWIVSDDLWERIEPLLPKRERRFRYPGRKPVPDRQVQSGIPFVLHPGVQWEHLPEKLDFGSASDTRQTRAPSTAASKSARRWVAGTSARIHMAMVHGGPLSPAWAASYVTAKRSSFRPNPGSRRRNSARLSNGGSGTRLSPRHVNDRSSGTEQRPWPSR